MEGCKFGSNGRACKCINMVGGVGGDDLGRLIDDHFPLSPPILSINNPLAHSAITNPIREVGGVL